MCSRLPVFIILIFIFSVSCGNEEQQQTNQAEPGPAESAGLSGTDLRAAALDGHLPLVRDAISEGIATDDTDELGWSALMYASFNGHTEIVRLLIDEGAEVNLANGEGRTPLMFAASGPFSETVLLLLEEGAELNIQDSIEGWTALMYAAAEGNLDVVEVLLDHGADASLEDKDGETAIDFAANNGHTQIAEHLRSSL